MLIVGIIAPYVAIMDNVEDAFGNSGPITENVNPVLLIAYIVVLEDAIGAPEDIEGIEEVDNVLEDKLNLGYEFRTL